MQTLIDYESGQVYNTDGTLMETNEEIKEEYQRDIVYNKVYPALQHSASLYNGSLYFNLGNKIYAYSLKDASVDKALRNIINYILKKNNAIITNQRRLFFEQIKPGDNTN